MRLQRSFTHGGAEPRHTMPIANAIEALSLCSQPHRGPVLRAMPVKPFLACYCLECHNSQASKVSSI